jgi:hypothetical protein
MYQYNQMINVPDTSGSYLLIGGPFAQILSSLIAETFRCTLAKMFMPQRYLFDTTRPSFIDH